MISKALLREIEATTLACQQTIYREDSSQLHDDLTKQMFAWVQERVTLSKDSYIADIGCGMGGAMDLFSQTYGIRCDGFTMNSEEAEVCRKKGHNVYQDDMHEGLMYFDQGGLDGIWLRHAAEHSFMPLVLLRLCKRALAPGGWLYMEVPAPDTPCLHQNNMNHFSCFAKSAWIALLAKAGFESYDSVDIKFTVQAGEDCYHGFLAR